MIFSSFQYIERIHGVHDITHISESLKYYEMVFKPFLKYLSEILARINAKATGIFFFRFLNSKDRSLKAF